VALRLRLQQQHCQSGAERHELNAEISVEIAIVMANCRKNWPTIPEMKAHGMNTAVKTRPTATTGTGNMLHVTNGRVARQQPLFVYGVRPAFDNNDGIVDDDPDGQHQPDQASGYSD